MRAVYVPVFLFSLLLPACQTSFTSDGAKTEVYPKSDSTPYELSFEANTRAVSNHNGFDLQMDLHATFLSNEFISLFERRYFERLPGTKDFPLKEAREKVGLFVSLYTPIKDNDMTDPKLWSYSLKSGAKEYKVFRIKKIKQKQEWSSFFPYINIWSTEYLLLFDLSPSELPSPLEGGKRGLELTLSNLQARTELTF